MKMDCFAAKVCLRDQTKILIGGLCISGVVPELLRRCRKLEDGTLPVNTAVGIDRAMAQMLDTLQMEGVFAAGAAASSPEASARFAKAGWRTGGVIGIPGTPPESADDQMERTKDGLYLFSRAGGPGFAAAVSEKQAIYLSEISLTVPPHEFCREIQILAADGYLAVFDGIGYQAKCILVVGAGQQRFWLES